MAEARHSEIQGQHEELVKMCTQIQHENVLATKLKKQMEHEKVVLEERKTSTVRILSQIGQDTAITEQQIRIVKVQTDKIQRLKKLLPEYQVAHERAVYKAIAIVADTKKIVQNLNMESLAELRAMQKPIIDIEDLMAAVIMILKNPQADLTWQKGAKRQMANLERFIEELVTFDDNVMPEATLALVEPYLKKPSFEAENMESKSKNSACASLCKWVLGVCRYNRMMISKVKPLHKKVEETTQAIDQAQHKMAALESKRKALEVRLAGLAKGFEEATIDKNDQEEKTIKMDTMLETAARLRKVLRKEQQRVQRIIDALPKRAASLPGGVAMAAAFATYLGPYHYNYRRMMLTIHWPNCLRERGVPLVIDSVDPVIGRVVDFSMDEPETAPGTSTAESANSYMLADEELEEEPDEIEEDGENQEENEGDTKTDPQETENKDTDLPDKESEKGDTDDMEKGGREEAEQEHSDKDEDESSKKEMEIIDQEEEEEEEEEIVGDGDQPADSQGAPSEPLSMISSDQYNVYVKALIKLLMGKEVVQLWIHKDFGSHMLENSAILCSSWQRPPILVDPYKEGATHLHWLYQAVHKQLLVTVDMDAKSNPEVVLALEKAVTKGQPILLDNCRKQIDSMVSPLVHHCNTALLDQSLEEPRMVKFCGRRILCHPAFKLYLSTLNPQPHFSPTIASTTTMINYGSSNETLVDDFLMRAFAMVQPELFKERRHALDNIHGNQKVMVTLYQQFKEHVTQNRNYVKEGIFKEEVEKLSDLTQKRNEMYMRIKDMQNLVEQLNALRDKLFPLARRATLLFALLRSLACIHQEYQFTLPHFLKLFDKAIGGELPPEFFNLNDQQADSNEPATEENTKQPPAEVNDQAEGGDAETMPEDPENRPNQQDAENPQVIEATDDNEEQSVELPTMTPLPTEGIDYSSLPDNQIKQLIDRLTSIVYSKIQMSLYEEHRLLFASLLCVTVEEDGGEKVSEEEVSLLLQGNPGLGMQLSLADFDCDQVAPSWLPSDKWDDVMALSVLPGPLDSLCVHVATNSEAWLEWYKSAKPEEISLPLADKTEDEEKERDETSSPNLGPLSEFHQLLLIRMLRPDRLPVAMTAYIQSHLGFSMEGESLLSGQDLLADVRDGHTGVLVLLPPSGQNNNLPGIKSAVKIVRPVLDVLRELGENLGISVDSVTVFNGCEDEVLDAVNTAHSNNAWIVIDNMHLATNKLCQHLLKNLANLDKETKSPQSNFCVWLTSEPAGKLPVELVNTLYKISWDKLQGIAAADGTAQKQEGGQPVEQQQQFYTSLEDVLTQAMSTTFNLITKEHLQKLAALPQSIKLAAFGICVIHAVLVARQEFGSRGLSQTYPLGTAQLAQALDALCSPAISGKDGGNPIVEDLCRIITEVVYNNLMCNSWDQQYVRTLVHYVFQSLLVNHSDTLDLGSVHIPTPPANVDPEGFSRWFSEKTQGQVSTLDALSLPSNVARTVNDAMAVEFLHLLDRLHEAQNMDLGDIHTKVTTDVNVLQLRAILDDVLQHLPPLLELGDVPEITFPSDFPYHRPSVLSLATAESIVMPESIGFVLLQECLWMNKLLCHIREHVHAVHQRLLSGPESFPPDMDELVQSLMKEHVPAAWIHPNCQPSTHNLPSWQENLKKSYQQMHKWTKHGMIPLYREGRLTPESRGRLRSVWLGGLVNPRALFTAMRQEKAIISNCLIDQVELDASVSASFDADTFPDDDETGLYVRDLYLQGAAWDLESNSLTHASQDLNVLPSLYVRPVLKSSPVEKLEGQNTPELGKEDGAEGSETVLFKCTAFMNSARQVAQFSLPLRSTEPSETWVLAGTSLILDPGVPEDCSKKLRSYVNPRPAPGAGNSDTAPTHQSVRVSSTAGIKHDDRASNRSEDDQRSLSHPSVQSQMSYKAMSPKASPLPPELSMTREKPMLRKPSNGSLQSAQTETQKSDKESDPSHLSKSPSSLNKGSNKDSDEHSGSKDSVAMSYKSKQSKISKRSVDDHYSSKGSIGRQPTSDSIGGQSKDSVGQQSAKESGSLRSQTSIKDKTQDNTLVSEKSLGQDDNISHASQHSGLSHHKQKSSTGNKTPDSGSVHSANDHLNEQSEAASLQETPQSEKSEVSNQSAVQSEASEKTPTLPGGDKESRADSVVGEP